MSSGSYSALSGAIAKMQALETTINNLANADTIGFKKDLKLFESFLNNASQVRESNGINYTRISRNYTKFDPGPRIATTNPLDLSINGEGFFRVSGIDGTFYTRTGSFTAGPDGTLLTSSGHQLLDAKDSPIIVADAQDVQIDDEGRVFSRGEEVAQIAVYSIDDLSLLEKRGNNLFALPSSNIKMFKLMDEPKVMQGYLEGSNVNIIQEMALMMDNQRSFEMYQKIRDTFGDMADKANEIGVL